MGRYAGTHGSRAQNCNLLNIFSHNGPPLPSPLSSSRKLSFFYHYLPLFVRDPICPAAFRAQNSRIASQSGSGRTDAKRRMSKLAWFYFVSLVVKKAFAFVTAV